MPPLVYTFGSNLKKSCSIVCLNLVLLAIISNFCPIIECHRNEKRLVGQRILTNDVTRQQHQMVNDEPIGYQKQIQSEDYENLSQNEETIPNGDSKLITEQEKIVPEKETNGNSQVVYVNLARVVSETNDTARVISSHQQLIKQDGQIACGETNKNGHPSLNLGGDSSTVDNLNRIVGGNKAEPGEFPYQVRLNIRSRRGSSMCGGVIIDKRHILTAAHCMTTW